MLQLSARFCVYTHRAAAPPPQRCPHLLREGHGLRAHRVRAFPGAANTDPIARSHDKQAAGSLGKARTDTGVPEAGAWAVQAGPPRNTWVRMPGQEGSTDPSSYTWKGAHHLRAQHSFSKAGPGPGFLFFQCSLASEGLRSSACRCPPGSWGLLPHPESPTPWPSSVPQLLSTWGISPNLGFPPHLNVTK